MTSKIYSTDLTDNQWQYIEKTLLFEERKRKHELKEIFNGIFYLLKTGCQWRMLPKEYPKWELVYYYFRKWSFYEDFERIFAWFDNDRRLCRNYEVKFEAAEDIIKIATIKLLINKI